MVLLQQLSLFNLVCQVSSLKFLLIVQSELHTFLFAFTNEPVGQLFGRTNRISLSYNGQSLGFLAFSLDVLAFFVLDDFEI